jgi:hypothetical protein
MITIHGGQVCPQCLANYYPTPSSLPITEEIPAAAAQVSLLSKEILHYHGVSTFREVDISSRPYVIGWASKNDHMVLFASMAFD